MPGQRYSRHVSTLMSVLVWLQLTREDQQRDDNWRRYTLSRWAECSTLKSPYDGDIRLVLLPGETPGQR